MRPFFSHSFHLGRSPITTRPLFTHFFVLVKEGRQMGSQVALVKGNRQMGFQVDRVAHSLVLVKEGRQKGSQVALVKGNCQMGFQVDRATHILWFWLKEVARWDLR
jgi:hypothetical protein